MEIPYGCRRNRPPSPGQSSAILRLPLQGAAGQPSPRLRCPGPGVAAEAAPSCTGPYGSTSTQPSGDLPSPQLRAGTLGNQPSGEEHGRRRRGSPAANRRLLQEPRSRALTDAPSPCGSLTPVSRGLASISPLTELAGFRPPPCLAQRPPQVKTRALRKPRLRVATATAPGASASASAGVTGICLPDGFTICFH